MVKGGVENPHLGNSRKQRFAGFDSLQVVGIVERSELDALAEGGFHFFGYEDRIGEILAAVHDAVPNAIDFRFAADEAVLRMQEKSEYHFDRHTVVQDFPDLPEPVPAFGLVRDNGIVGPDLLDHALGEEALVFSPDELELHGGAAAVQYEYLHGRAFL